MNVLHFKTLKSYLDHIKISPKEAETLFQEILIGVTSFFRDPEAFDCLKKSALQTALEQKPNYSTFRVWVPGCSTGEEAYSLAILLDECLKKIKTTLEIQIFATDLDPTAIDTARSGTYPEGIVADISPRRLKNYFIREENHFKIKKSIRDLIVFAPQNTIKDPPFTKVDLISCRNLLIYLDSITQQKILETFHYSLLPGGTLFLGNSESLGNCSNLFQITDNKWKIYTKISQSDSTRPHFRFLDTIANQPEEFTLKKSPAKTEPTVPNSPSHIEKHTKQYLLDHLTPSSLLVDEKGKIIFIHGRTGDFLEPAQGQPSNNIWEMSRERLKVELASGLRNADLMNKPVFLENIEIRNNGGFNVFNISVEKIQDDEFLNGLFLISFKPVPSKTSKTNAKKPPSGSGLKSKDSNKEKELKLELLNTKETLKNTIEALQTTNEELKSTNEEMQSANEELQSSNEEIETSKEEMQSLNEELQTANAELQSKISEYSMASDDMKNLLNSTSIATLFLDLDLNILRFTQEAREIIHLLHTDIGRPLADLVSNLKYDHLILNCSEVVNTLRTREMEVQSNADAWYRVRITP